jgi:hypothetical protein
MYRPTEDKALQNLEREEKLVQIVRDAALTEEDLKLWIDDRQGLSLEIIAAKYGFNVGYVLKRLLAIGAALTLAIEYGITEVE